MVSAPRTPPQIIRAASAVTDVSLEPALRCLLHASGRARALASTFIFCLACLVSYRPLGQQSEGTPPKLFAPGLSPRLAPVSRFRFGFAVSPCPRRRACFASRPEGCDIKIVFASSSIDCAITTTVPDATCRRGTSAPDFSANPSSLPTVGRRVPAGTSAQPSCVPIRARYPLLRSGGVRARETR